MSAGDRNCDEADKWERYWEKWSLKSGSLKPMNKELKHTKEKLQPMKEEPMLLKKALSENNFQTVLFLSHAGFEPATHRLRVCCSTN